MEKSRHCTNNLFLQNLFSPVANAREPLLCLKYTLAIVAIDEEKYAIAASIICVGHFGPDCVRLNSVALRHGLVVRIAGSHPAGPGSIPGGGKYLFSFAFLITLPPKNDFCCPT